MTQIINSTSDILFLLTTFLQKIEFLTTEERKMVIRIISKYTKGVPIEDDYYKLKVEEK